MICELFGSVAEQNFDFFFSMKQIIVAVLSKVIG